MSLQPIDWSVNGLATETKIDRRTVAKRLENVPPYRVAGKVKFWRGACHAGGVRAMEAWLAAELAAAGLEQVERHRILDGLEWWRDKPPALVLLDDRAMTFAGTWPKLDELLAFRPWNRRGAG